MKRVSLLLLLFIASFCSAQIYKYISVENGLSSRMVYSIKQDKKGYMWFLTHDGIDRFDGKRFKHYRLNVKGADINSFVNINQLYTDTTGCVWEIGKDGQIFKYNTSTDSFQFIYKLGNRNKNEQTISFAYFDEENTIWLGLEKKAVYTYNIDNHTSSTVSTPKDIEITNMVQVDKETYCISTPNNICAVRYKNHQLQKIDKPGLDTLNIQLNAIYYHKATESLYLGSFLKGLYIYDFKKNKLIHPDTGLQDININSISALNDDEILIATDGAGVYKIDTHTFACQPYIVANYNEPNGMNGNNINDLFIDNEQRIWMANYPMGITVLNNRYPGLKWIKHSIGNEQSLINDQVNAILEDSDGDVWFATNNGISLYHSKTHRWTNLLSSFHSDAQNKNHIFITLCEVMPGIIWVGGYTSGMYWINKKEMKPHYFVPQLFHKNIRADKYIRAIYKDSQGLIWAGGYYYLKRINIKEKTLDVFNGLHAINAIIDKDSTYLWVGCRDGLYLINKQNKKIKRVNLPVEDCHVNVLYQSKDGILYIGTNGNGLLVYNPENQKVKAYNIENSSLLSNTIYSILSDGKGRYMVLSTENSLSRFSIKDRTFSNWTPEQGLNTSHFNATSGTYTSQNSYLIGSGDGVVEFNADINIPKYYSSKLVFSDFRIFYQTIHPNQKNSPLVCDIDDTKSITLSCDQNLFSLNLSSINYDYPSNILYSWKLEGFYDEWSKPGPENLVRYTNLIPGHYRLLVRAISKEDQYIIEERGLNITITPSFWATPWAVLIYLAIFALIGWAFLRYFLMKKERRESGDKINFFVNTAHDIRTPLTLIKAPLDDIQQNENLSFKGSQNLQMAIRSTNNLYGLISNLIDFEKVDVYSEKLNPDEHELNSYIKDLCAQFQAHADSKNIDFSCECTFPPINVWFDKGKMDAILKNMIINALKYTPLNGKVSISASLGKDSWSIQIKDSGIGIPQKEQKKIFNQLFRASNALNSNISGSGIGLMLVHKLVHMHHGKIALESSEGIGTTFKLTFPVKQKKLADLFKNHLKAVSITPVKPAPKTAQEVSTVISPAIPANNPEEQPIDVSFSRIVVVEDNDDLRNYLKDTLSDNYTVYTAVNGEEGLHIIRIAKPDLVVSDIMMPVMDGEEMCRQLKSDIEISHIPVILLTAKASKQDILHGLESNADRYLTKPFEPPILRATIKNVLENNALLRRKFAQMDIQEADYKNCNSLLDFEFMAKVNESIEKGLDDKNFSVDVLASKVNMSRSSFYTKLKALTDQSPSDCIREARLNKAAKLLKTKQNTVTEIAEITGYYDAKHFREAFKKKFGVTPTQYADGIPPQTENSEEKTKE